MTIQRDATGQSFTSALAIDNPNGGTGSHTICAFTTNGVFVGGSSFDIPPRGRFFAVTPAAQGVMNLADFLLPVKKPLAFAPGSGAGGAGFPANQDIHLITNVGKSSVSAGFIGNDGQFLAFYGVPEVSCCDAHFPNVGAVGDVGVNTMFYVSNPGPWPIKVIFRSYADDGSPRTISPSMEILGYNRLTIAASSLGIRNLESVRITEPNNQRYAAIAVIVYPTWAVGGASVSIQTPVSFATIGDQQTAQSFSPDAD